MLYYVLAVIGLLLIILIIIDIIDLNRFSVSDYLFMDERISSEICFVVLSDLHNKEYGKQNKKLIDAIEKIHPDVILCAGDIMTANKGKDFSPAVRLMERLGAKYPVYYGMGNHEYRAGLYLKTYQDMYERYFKALANVGIKVLKNEHIYLKEHNIDICGLEIDRKYYKRFTTYPMESGYIAETVGKPKDSAYQVLIAHNPEYCPEYAAWGADLTLSGHVHGGLIRFPIIGGVASPAVKFFPKYDAGLYKFKDKSAIVSRGLGTHTLPLRVFNPGELLVIKLTPKEGTLAKRSKN